MMKTYARIENSIVVELLETDGDISTMFHSDLMWVECDRLAQQGWAYDGAEFTRPMAPEPEFFVPQSVSRFQLLMALHNAELLDTVEMMMTDPNTPMLYRLAWKEGRDFGRHSQTIAAIAVGRGLSDKQIDDLFIAAEQIEG